MYPMGPMPPMMLPPEQLGGMPPYMPPNALPVRQEQNPIQLPNDKEQLGELLYALVEKKDTANAAKITGMLLEMEVEQIQNIIRDPSQLDKWILEARKVLY